MINSEILFQTFDISYVGYSAVVVFCLFVTMILPRLKIITGSVITFVFLCAFMAYYNFRFSFEMVLPVLFLVVGYGTVIARQYLITGNQSGKETTENFSAEKMMGLFYQQQGMLDLAFEKFRSVPLEEDIKDLIYGLGGAFEKQGDIEKALDAYRLIAESAREGKNTLATNVLYPTDTADLDTKTPNVRSSVPEGALESEHIEIPAEYELIEEMTAGGYGKKYKARHVKTDTPVVISCISFPKTGTEPNSAMRGRFFEHMEILDRMRHENILAVSGFGEIRGLYYVAMEDFDGEPLTSYIKNSRLLSVRESLHAIAQATDAMYLAHKQGFVHHFLRPESIIRSNHSQKIKIKDLELYGMVSMTGVRPNVSSNGHVYMSPEEIAGKQVDGRSDIFSLGVILFELLTGEKPFPGEDLTHMMLKVSKEKHVSPRFFNPRIPLVIEKILDKALEKDMEKRYQDAGQMAEHLNKVIRKIDALREQKKPSASELHII